MSSARMYDVRPTARGRRSHWAAWPVAAVLAGSLLTALAAPVSNGATTHPGTRLWGVTLDDVTHAGALSHSLERLPRRATARVVFDPGLGPASYASAVHRLHRVADVLGQPVDSSETASYSRAAYRSRFGRYVAAFPRAVDVWEVGNEVNGEWTGRPDDVVAKTLAAYRIAHRAGKQTALTLYFNPGCADDAAHRTFTWVRKRLPATLLNGPTYVLLSYYPSVCDGYWPGPAHWQRVFDRLHGLFPHALLGFGEAGTTRTSLPQARRAALLHRYDDVDVRGDRFVGGGFWWSFAEDARSTHTAVWRALDADMRAGR